VSESWAPWVKERTGLYKNNLEKKIELHGKERAEMMLEFYQTVSDLF